SWGRLPPTSRAATLLRRNVRPPQAHPRRREEGPHLAGRRRRPAFAARRPRDRDRGPLQPADRSLRALAGRGSRAHLAGAWRAAHAHGAQAAQDPGHRALRALTTTLTAGA